MWGDILTVKNSKTGTVGKRQCLSTYYNHIVTSLIDTCMLLIVLGIR